MADKDYTKFSEDFYDRYKSRTALEDKYDTEEKKADEPSEEKPKRISEFFKHIFYTKPLIGIVSAAIIGLSGGGNGGGFIAHNYETNRTSQYQIAFSEKHQIVLDAQLKGKEVDTLPEALTTVNDCAMKVLECYNRSKDKYVIDPLKKFIDELEMKSNPKTNKYHYSLDTLFHEYPKQSNNLLAYFSPYFNMSNAMIAVRDAFSSSWSKYYHDNTHEDCHTDCTTDSDGDESCTEHCTTVYDNTDYRYTYYPDRGLQASIIANNFVERYPQIKIIPPLPVPSKVNEDNAKAIISSIKGRDPNAPLSNDSLMYYSTFWRRGASISQMLPKIYGNYGSLKNDAANWNTAKLSSRSVSYTIYDPCHTDAGPRGYQITQEGVADAQGFISEVSALVGNINEVQSDMNTLHRYTDQLLAIGKKGEILYSDIETNKEKLAKKTVEQAIKTYQHAFKRGLPLESYRKWFVAVSAIGGALLLGGAFAGGGYGLSRLQENKYGRRRRSYYSQGFRY